MGIEVGGKYGYYGGPGYGFRLPATMDLEDAQEFIEKLEKNCWIDVGTRAILIRFNINGAILPSRTYS